MIVFPNAKINLGLNILRKREDGYHDISSVFYPVKECVDILEIVKSDNFQFTKSGIEIPNGENICEKAWNLLHTDFEIGNVKIHLHKQIAIGAGLGGGASLGSGAQGGGRALRAGCGAVPCTGGESRVLPSRGVLPQPGRRHGIAVV